jgi:hypothetical protein
VFSILVLHKLAWKGFDYVMHEDALVRGLRAEDNDGSDDAGAEFVGESSSSDNSDVGDDDDGDAMTESAKLDADLVTAFGQQRRALRHEYVIVST